MLKAIVEIAWPMVAIIGRGRNGFAARMERGDTIRKIAIYCRHPYASPWRSRSARF
jgi:hypothetical protein